MTKNGLSIKRNDTVVVIAGKEKGKRGKVLVVLPEKQRVVVERVNFIKRHQRPTQKVRQGGIIEREGSLHVSNVMLVCGKCDKPTRTGIQILADGRRARVCRQCGEIVDKA
ncbi:MAG: 50S ribosomal protein L24 [Candidatus Rokubacteria bacterium]|nr:50S ribosomal protein L24 [Candidatus Rokubacteria bacterium]